MQLYARARVIAGTFAHPFAFEILTGAYAGTQFTASERDADDLFEGLEVAVRFTPEDQFAFVVRGSPSTCRPEPPMPAKPTRYKAPRKPRAPRKSRACERSLLAVPEHVFEMMHPFVSHLQQETFWVIAIDVRNRVIDKVETARGSLTGVEVHPREVFRPAILLAAAGIVVCHNHPSGDPTPSPEDIQLTRRLRAAGELIGIPVIDHVVIGDDSFRSIAEWMGTEL